MIFKFIVTLFIVVLVSCANDPIKPYAPSKEECIDICQKYIYCENFTHPIKEKVHKYKLFNKCMNKENINMNNVEQCHCSTHSKQHCSTIIKNNLLC